MASVTGCRREETNSSNGCSWREPERRVHEALRTEIGWAHKVRDLHRRWSQDGDYKAAYDELDEEFQLARTLIEARTRTGLSQTQLARRMKTSQSYVARIEGGKVPPSTGALERFAAATGTRLRIVFEPYGAH